MLRSFALISLIIIFNLIFLLESSLSQRKAAQITKNENYKDGLAVPVAAGVCGGLVLILALITGLVIGHRRLADIFSSRLPKFKSLRD